MKTAAFFILFFLTSIAWAQKNAGPPENSGPNMTVEAKHPNFVKNWFVSLGPVISNNLVGFNGTKYAVTVGYEDGLSEHWSLLYFSDNNFNSGSQGSTLIQSINAGAQYFLRDRGADNSLFVQADVGYGGGNKFYDANVMGGLGLGLQIYRNGEFTFQAFVREGALYVQGSGATTSSWPSFTQIMLGIYF